jgi:hypothetical protein
MPSAGAESNYARKQLSRQSNSGLERPSYLESYPAIFRRFPEPNHR